MYPTLNLMTICLLATGCGPTPSAANSLIVDPLYQSEVTLFQQQYGQITIPLKVREGRLPLPTIGWCNQWDIGTPEERTEIVIDQMVTDPLTLHIILWHELGHCVLKRSHTRGQINGHLKSIMNPEIPSNGEYRANQAYFDHELSHPAR